MFNRFKLFFTATFKHTSCVFALFPFVLILNSCSKGYYLKEPSPTSEAVSPSPDNKPKINVTSSIPNYCPPIKVAQENSEKAIIHSDGIAFIPQRTISRCDFLNKKSDGDIKNDFIFGTHSIYWIPPFKLKKDQSLDDNTESNALELYFDQIKNSDSLAIDLLQPFISKSNIQADRRLLKIVDINYTEVSLPVSWLIHWQNKVMNSLFFNDRIRIRFSSSDEKQSFISALKNEDPIFLRKQLRLYNDVQTFETQLSLKGTGKWTEIIGADNSFIDQIKAAQFISQNLNEKGYSIQEVQKLYPELCEQARLRWQSFPEVDNLKIIDAYLLPIAVGLEIENAKKVNEFFLKLKPLMIQDQNQLYLPVALQAATESISSEKFNTILKIASELNSSQSLTYYYLSSKASFNFWDSAIQISDLSEKYNQDIATTTQLVKTLIKSRVFLQFNNLNLSLQKSFILKSYSSSWSSSYIERMEKIFNRVYLESNVEIFSSVDDFTDALNPILNDSKLTDDEINVFSKSYNWLVTGTLDMDYQQVRISLQSGIKKALLYRKKFNLDSLNKLISLYRNLSRTIEFKKIPDSDLSDRLENHFDLLENFISDNSDVSAADIQQLSVVAGWLSQKNWYPMMSQQEDSSKPIEGTSFDVLTSFNKAKFLVLKKKLDSDQFEAFKIWVYTLVQKGQTPEKAVQQAMNDLLKNSDEVLNENN